MTAAPGEAAPYYGEHGLSAYLYDDIEQALIVEGVSPCCGDAAFYLDQARRLGGPALEIGTGSGRIAWALADAGIETVGVDLSPTMLRLAHRRGQGRDPAAIRRLTLINQNAATLALGRRFNLAFFSYRTLNHLTDALAQRQALTAAAAHLAPEGLLILHLAAPPDGAAIAPPRALEGAAAVDGGTAVWRVLDVGVDLLRQTIFNTVEYALRDERGTEIRRSVERLTYRWLWPQEALYLFELVGLTAVGAMERFPGAPDGAVRDQIWLLRRRGEG